MTMLSIVIPVFNALDETIDCVNSVLASDASNAQILLMDDGSFNDVSAALIAHFGYHDNIRIVSHFRNRGYTRNINFGVALSEGEYVCILNSDTLVPSIWVDPLLAALQTNPTLAGVGPASNAASYQSVPLVKETTGEFSVNDGLGLDPEERSNTNLILRHFTKGKVYDLPILNGFCTLFRRKSLEEVGAFDVQSFPQGYGEENDLCARIKAKGLRLGYVPSVFVHHQKSKSFGSARKTKLSKLGVEALSVKYGKRLIQSFSDQMEKMPELAAIRRLVEPNLYHPIIEKELTLGETHIASDTEVCTLLTIKGPAKIIVSDNRIKVENLLETTPLLTLNQSVDDTIEINLPVGLEAPLSDRSSIGSLLDWLSLVSFDMPVLLNSWSGLDAGTRARPFGMLYAAR